MGKAIGSPAWGLKSITTLMICGVPRSFSEQHLLDEVDRRIGRDSFDFFYLPWVGKHRTVHAGYALVNIRPPEGVERHCRSLSGDMRCLTTGKSVTITVKPARIQGLV